VLNKNVNENVREKGMKNSKRLETLDKH